MHQVDFGDHHATSPLASLKAEVDVIAVEVGREAPRQGWSAERLLAGDTVGPVLGLAPAPRGPLWSRPLQQATFPSSVYGLALRLIDAPLKIVRIPEPLSRRGRL